MQALTPDDYARLQRLRERYHAAHAHAFKVSAGGNPRLSVDMLCFQPLGAALCGALITPLTLSLALVPPGDATAQAAGAQCTVALPGGRYPFIAEWIDDDSWLWRCELLDDLSDLSSLEEANRLAQRLMEQVMAAQADE
ncbi:[NiFe]-hydrogenase assembly chaperone HybE [Halomonas sp. YLGW01]|uniref:[NiFe]-hydrogenase assembly chaperone HybE n=1 Tax=Halomonas sp. YLGW01 TaxID=2773308 RepID=UPI00178675AC|nr:[NiFe]-hydrogenase assembly chaperone HybE [Halomonas sp. YLGW01]